MSSNKQRQQQVNDQMGNHTVKPPSSVQEDWEKELEEISQRIEMQKQPDYDPDDLMTNMKGISHLNIQNGPSSVQRLYSPAVHHIQPVKWVRHVYAKVDDQFTDTE